LIFAVKFIDPSSPLVEGMKLPASVVHGSIFTIIEVMLIALLFAPLAGVKQPMTFTFLIIRLWLIIVILPVVVFAAGIE